MGIFDKVFALKLPASRPACIYVKLADAEGYYRLVLRLVHLNSGRTLAEALFQTQPALPAPRPLNRRSLRLLDRLPG